MFSIRNLSTKNKLLLLVVLPVIFIVIMASYILFNSYNKKNESLFLETNIRLNVVIAQLVNQLQIERDKTGYYLTTKGKYFSEEILKEREITNKYIAKLNEKLQKLDKSELPSKTEIYIKFYNENIKRIENIRDMADQNRPKSLSEILNFYTYLNKKLIMFISKSVTLATSTKVSNELAAYYNFVYFKEEASLERIIGADTFFHKSYKENLYSQFVNSIAMQESFFEAFYSYSDDEIQKEINYKNKESMKSLENMRKTLLYFERKVATLTKIKYIIDNQLLNNYRSYINKIRTNYKIKAQLALQHLNEALIEYKKYEIYDSHEKEIINEVNNLSIEIKKNINEAQAEFNLDNPSFSKIDKLSKVDYSALQTKLSNITDNFLNVKSKYWFDEYTKRISLLKEFDDSLINKLLIDIEEEVSLLNLNIILIFITLFIIVLCIIFIVFRINSILKEGINSIYLGTEQFMKYLNKEINELSYIDYKSKDELGQLALMVNKNIDRINGDLEKDLLCVGEATITLDKIEKGFYSYRVNSIAANPQVGTLAKTINKMLDNQQKVISNILGILEQYTHYNYLEKINMQDINGESKQMINGINSLGEAITSMLIENKNNGRVLEEASNNLLKNVDKLNNSTTSAAASLEETSASVEQVAGNIRSSTQNIAKMTNYTNELSNSTKNGENLANQTVQSMDDIDAEVGAINEAISVIDKIAFQTNILSLNAAVEAATAGEAGKGFAVVAAEVRNLASRSAEAANEIKGLVESATRKSKYGKDIATQMIQGFNHLSENINNTISLIKDVNSTSKEQEIGIGLISDAINSLDKQTQENADVSGITHDIAIKTLEIAKNVSSSIDNKQFKE